MPKANEISIECVKEDRYELKIGDVTFKLGQRALDKLIKEGESAFFANEEREDEDAPQVKKGKKKRK